MSINIIKHPLIKHKIGLLREESISTKDFRALVSEIAALLCYEAAKDFETEEVDIDCWSGRIQVDRLKGKEIAVVPILRAGMGMLDGVLSVFPDAKVNVVGIYRDEKTLEANVYYKKFSKDISERKVFVIDPMLATGHSLDASLEIVRQHNPLSISVLAIVAAPEGVKLISKKHPDVDLYIAAYDEKLNENGYIIPGLGDAGDKIFGTK